ncbi:MAG: hypothetical protein WCX71_00380 [Candidatus Buchananbacteria bacterium]
MDREFINQMPQSPEERESLIGLDKFKDDIIDGFSVKFPPDQPSEFAEYVKGKLGVRNLGQLNLEDRAREVIAWFDELAQQNKIDDDVRALVEKDMVIMAPSSGVVDKVAKVIGRSQPNRQIDVVKEYVPARQSRQFNAPYFKRRVAVTSSSAEKFFGQRNEIINNNSNQGGRQRPKPDVVLLDSGLQTVSGIDLSSGLLVMATRMASREEIARRREASNSYIPLYDKYATDDHQRPVTYGKEIPDENYLADFDGFVLEALKEKNSQPVALWVEKLRENVKKWYPKSAEKLEKTVVKELMVFDCLDENGQVTEMAGKCLEAMEHFGCQSLGQARRLVEAKENECVDEVLAMSQLIDEPKSNQALLSIEDELLERYPNETVIGQEPLLDRWLNVLTKLQALSKSESETDLDQDFRLERSIKDALYSLSSNLSNKTEGIKKSFIAGQLPLLVKHYLFPSRQELNGSAGLIELAKTGVVIDDSQEQSNARSKTSTLYNPDGTKRALLLVTNKIIGFDLKTNRDLLNGNQDKGHGVRNLLAAGQFSNPEYLAEVAPEILEELSPYLFKKLKPWLEEQQELIEEKRLKDEREAQLRKDKENKAEADRIAAKERKTKPPSQQDINNLSNFFKNR